MGQLGVQIHALTFCTFITPIKSSKICYVPLNTLFAKNTWNSGVTQPAIRQAWHPRPSRQSRQTGQTRQTPPWSQTERRGTDGVIIPNRPLLLIQQQQQLLLLLLLLNKNNNIDITHLVACSFFDQAEGEATFIADHLACVITQARYGTYLNWA